MVGAANLVQARARTRLGIALADAERGFLAFVPGQRWSNLAGECAQACPQELQILHQLQG